MPAHESLVKLVEFRGSRCVYLFTHTPTTACAYIQIGLCHMIARQTLNKTVYML